MSKVQANLFDKWLRNGGKRGRALKGWIEKDTPLGIEKPMECYDIYPNNDSPKKCWVVSADMAIGSAVDNFLSMKHQPEDAEIEVKNAFWDMFTKELVDARGCRTRSSSVASTRMAGWVPTSPLASAAWTPTSTVTMALRFGSAFGPPASRR